ncbi:protein kinase [Aeromonas veronii]|uniref:protein kinase domain-containing protein n=1 Tax=Aeromonas veronii TaxID=654 RepID=UPI001F3D693E|nr:protein kinase [Aeromonas veronii]MCF5765561.1 protein kinase [Aeromonas veronii]
MDECGHYFLEDLERLGRGGFGEVYKVNIYNHRRNHVSQYARKYFSPAPENDQTHVKVIANLRERFIVEIKTQYTLNALNYNLIAPVVLFSIGGEKPYFVMELAECNLRHAIIAGMTDTEKSRAIVQILKGVKLIHDNNYIHRDLKPENILKYNGGMYKISDFGLVKDLDTVRAEIKTRFNPNALGTDGYRAPEISDSGIFSKQTDIYALGKIINDIYAGSVPHAVRGIINTCTTFIPDYRYESVDKLLQEFNKATNNATETV